MLAYEVLLLLLLLLLLDAFNSCSTAWVNSRRLISRRCVADFPAVQVHPSMRNLHSGKQQGG